MVKLFIDIYYIWKNEMKLVFRDPAILLILVGVPLMYPPVYSFIYDNEIVTKVPIVVVDKSQSAMSRQFARMVGGASAINIKGYVTDLDEAKHQMMSRDVSGILYIPENFSKDLNTLQPTEVLLFADMNNLMYYQAMATTVTTVSQMMGAAVRASALGPGTPRMQEIMMQPVQTAGQSYYNPTGGFASSVIPAVLVLVIQQAILLGVATIVGTHKDRKTFTVASHVEEGRYVNSLRLTIGKALCYGSFYIVLCCWTLGVVPYLFNFPQIGHHWTLLVFLQPYVLAATFFSMTLAYFCSQREFPMLLFVFTSPLFLFLSGISWPWISVPPLLQSLGAILPSTYGIHGFVQINTMGASLSDVWDAYVSLWILSIVYMLTATLMYKWWIKNYDPLYKGKIPA